MAMGGVTGQAWPSWAISAAPHAQTPPPPDNGPHAGQVPGLDGLHGARHNPATHNRPDWQGVVPLQAWHSAAPDAGTQTRAVSLDKPTHCVPEPHVVAVQPMHPPRPLQHARQKARFASIASVMHIPHMLQTPETSQRSPTLPVGVQVPLVQP